MFAIPLELGQSHGLDGLYVINVKIGMSGLLCIENLAVNHYPISWIDTFDLNSTAPIYYENVLFYFREKWLN